MVLRGRPRGRVGHRRTSLPEKPTPTGAGFSALRRENPSQSQRRHVKVKGSKAARGVGPGRGGRFLATLLRKVARESPHDPALPTAMESPTPTSREAQPRRPGRPDPDAQNPDPDLRHSGFTPAGTRVTASLGSGMIVGSRGQPAARAARDPNCPRSRARSRCAGSNGTRCRPEAEPQGRRPRRDTREGTWVVIAGMSAGQLRTQCSPPLYLRCA